MPDFMEIHEDTMITKIENLEFQLFNADIDQLKRKSSFRMAYIVPDVLEYMKTVW